MQEPNPYGLPTVLAFIGMLVWIIMLFLGYGI
jgi:hypothetical protein